MSNPLANLFGAESPCHAGYESKCHAMCRPENKLKGTIVVPAVHLAGALNRITKPAAPTDFQVWWGSCPGAPMRWFNMSWVDNSDDESGFQIEYTYGVPAGTHNWEPASAILWEAADCEGMGDGPGGNSHAEAQNFCWEFRIRSYKTCASGTVYSAWSDWVILHKYGGH